ATTLRVPLEELPPQAARAAATAARATAMTVFKRIVCIPEQVSGERGRGRLAGRGRVAAKPRCGAVLFRSAGSLAELSCLGPLLPDQGRTASQPRTSSAAV